MASKDFNIDINVLGKVLINEPLISTSSGNKVLVWDSSNRSLVTMTNANLLSNFGLTASLITSTSAAGTTNIATTNANTYLNIIQDGTSVGSSSQITGAGSVTVSSTSAGKITISGTDTNTTYGAGTANTLGLSKLFSDTIQSVAANTVSTSASRTYGIQTNSTGQMVVNVPWSDTNTTYTAGTGLVLSGTSFGQTVTTSGTGTFVTGVVQTANGLQINLGTPPDTNTNTTYTAGTGLSLAGTVFGQAITVSGTGSFVESITQNATGFDVVMGTPPDTNTNTTYTAGTGISLTGNAFGQAITTSGTGTFVTGVTQTTNGLQFNLGTPPNTDTNTTYSAGTGISLSGTTFGQSITTSGTGTFVTGVTQTTNGIQFNLGTPPDTNTNTTYTAGTGLSLSGTSFSVNYGTTSTTAAAGNHTHTFSSITSKPSTLSGYGISDAYTKSEITSMLSSTYKVKGSVVNMAALPSTGQSEGDVWNLLDTGDNYVWVVDLNNTGSPGWDMLAGVVDLSGYVPTSRTISINGTTYNLSANRSFTTPNTTYSAGTGVSLSGTSFGQAITSSGSGTFVTGVTQTTNGFQVNFGTPPNTNTTYTAGTGLSLSGTVFGQAITTSGTGTFVTSVTQTTGGLQFNLGTPPDTNTNTTYTAGNGLNLSSTSFSLGTPGTLTASTTSAVTSTSHTHAITTTTSGAANTIVQTDASGIITGQGLAVSSQTGGDGISLYGTGTGTSTTLPTYGLSFAQTSTFGKYGPVTGDYATYFTMGTANRGWIFKGSSVGTGSNVASISIDGAAQFASTVTAPTFDGNLSGNATTSTTATNVNRSVTGGNGLTGGGTLTANQVITLGTPGSTTLSTTNAVTSTSHTHDFTPGGTTAQYISGAGTLITFPSIPAGTVTSITAGNGLNFTTISSTGAITLGTPGTLSAATSNGVTSTSHTHSITTTAVGAANTIVQTNSTGGTKFTGTVETPKIEINPFEIVYNANTNSLDFNYIG